MTGKRIGENGSVDESEYSVRKTDRAAAGLNRRTLLAALGLTGATATSYLLLRNDSDQKSQTKATKLDVEGPAEEIVQRYRSRTGGTTNVDATTLSQPEFATEEMSVTADPDVDLDNAVFEQAVVTPASETTGDIFELTISDSQGRTVSATARLTRAVLGLGTETSIEGTVNTTTLDFQGGEIPHTESYAVVAGNSSDNRVYVIRAQSVDSIRQIVDNYDG